MMRRFLCAFLALVLIVCLLPLNLIEARAASAMKASDDIIHYLKDMEGFTPIPRWDYVQWTVGYGNRCPDEDLERYLEEGIPIEEADALFLEQLVYFEDQVNAFMDRNGLTFTQNQFDAVLSITYNCGAAWLTSDNDLKDAICNGTTGNTLVGLISQRCTAGGEYLPGLMRRRLTEADMFLNGRYNTQTPDNYCYVFFDPGEGKADAVAQGYDCNLYAVPLVTATREGYTFLGWYTEATGGVKVTYLDENLHQDTLYAHWQEGEGEYVGDSTPIPDGVQVTVTGDVVNVRSGPGTTYSVINSVICGEKILVTQVVTGKDKRLWGKIDKGWLCLEYTTYSDVVGDSGDSDDASKEEDAYHAPVYATIVGSSTIPIYNGPDTGYPKLGTLQEGQEVLIVQTRKMYNSWWGRLESGGWICLNRYVLLHNDQMLAHSVKVTVTNSYVNVRSGPGTQNSWLDSLNKGDVIEILAVEVVDNSIWGRYYGGWVSLQYTSFDASKLEQYKYHHYQSWYTTSESTCVTHGQQRRDCKYCSDYETQELPYAEHIMGQWYETQASTCVDHGQERRDCQICTYYEIRETELSGHTLGQWQTEIAPTCTEEGLSRRYCQYCDVYEEQPIAATGHTFGQWQTEIAPTCTEEGLSRRYCQHCDVYEEEPVAATGHSFGEWYETVAPTLTEGGEERRDCQNCDHYEIRSTEPAEHLYNDWYVTVEATCTEDGQMRRDCIDCEHYETKVIPATGHSFGDWYVSVDATCTDGGELCRECTVCDHVETKATEPAAHQYGDWYVSKDATCTDSGEMRRDCAACGHSETQVITASGHQYGAWEVVNPGNCTEDYVQQRVCSNCGDVQTETESAPGHTMLAWYTVTEATCTAEGLQRRDCQHCDHSETAPIEKLSHNYCDWYISIEPTYEIPGQERRDCEDCGAYETREKAFNGQVITKLYATITCDTLNVRSGPGTGNDWVGTVSYGSVHEVFEQTTVGDKIWARIEKGWICITGYARVDEVTEVIAHSHSFGEWYSLEEATCTEPGKQRRDCACGHYETQIVAATGHTYGNWYSVQEATCTTDGLQRRDCACGHYETRVAAATGHSFGDWYTVTEATADKNGLEQRDCQNCDHYEQRETTYQVETVTKIYGTLTGYDYLNIRSGPGTNYAWAGRLYRGDRVEILEIRTYSSTQWGRIEQGWICITGYITLEEVQEPVEHTHSFGDWYTVTEPTCTTDGQQRRDCACGEFETQSIAATGHSFGEWYTVKEATASENGLEQRDCKNCDHYEQRETTYEVETVTKIYGTLTGNSYLNIRAGIGTGYAIVGQLKYGERVEMLEIVQYGNHQWGRLDRGWVQITGYITLEEVQEPVEHTHSFGDWYTVTEATCTTDGQQRRDCACGEFETQSIAATGHSFGEWYTVKEATASENGLERRECACGHYEERETTYEVETVTKIYGTLTGYSYLNIRAGIGTGYAIVGQLKYGERVEILEIVQYGNHQWGRLDRGWVQITGYITLEEVEEPVEGNSTNSMTVTATVLNVRAGAGTGYNIVTSLTYGTKVTVLETKVVNGVTWARVDQGWVSMAYLA